MIPDFNNDGLLPPGIHSATLEEFAERFAIFDRSDRRLRLFEKLARLIHDSRSSGIVNRLFVVGSYVTDQAEPNDYDCLIFFDRSVSGQTLRPSVYNVISSTTVKRIYGGDIITVREDAQNANSLLGFFQLTRLQEARGIVEILL